MYLEIEMRLPNLKFYQLHISLNPKIAAKYDFKTIWYKFNETGNKDEYGNFITDYSFVSDNTYEIYCDYKYAKTMSEWEIWIEKNLLSDKNGFELNFENTWEVLKEKEKDMMEFLSALAGVRVRRIMAVMIKALIVFFTIYSCFGGLVFIFLC